jgi:hypothetical protein
MPAHSLFVTKQVVRRVCHLPFTSSNEKIKALFWKPDYWAYGAGELRSLSAVTGLTGGDGCFIKVEFCNVITDKSLQQQK